MRMARRANASAFLLKAERNELKLSKPPFLEEMTNERERKFHPICSHGRMRSKRRRSLNEFFASSLRQLIGKRQSNKCLWRICGWWHLRHFISSDPIWEGFEFRFVAGGSSRRVIMMLIINTKHWVRMWFSPNVRKRQTEVDNLSNSNSNFLKELRFNF